MIPFSVAFILLITIHKMLATQNVICLCYAILQVIVVSNAFEEKWVQRMPGCRKGIYMLLKMHIHIGRCMQSEGVEIQ